MNYKDSKVSIFIENQFPSFVRRNGSAFVDFIQTYYDWLEKRVVILTLKSKYNIEDEDIEIGDILNTTFFSLISEVDEDVLIDESYDANSVFDNDYSLFFDGVNDYVDVANSIFTISSDWSIGCFIKLNEYPSVLRNNFDIITLNNSEYFSILRINEDSNEITLNIDGTEYETDFLLIKDIWYYVGISYDASETEIKVNLFSDGIFEEKTFSIDLTSITANRFVIGCDLYNSRNFYNGFIDEIAIWDEVIANTEFEAIYNDGTAIDLTVNQGDYNSNSTLSNYYRFGDANTTVALNSINSNNNGSIYNEPEYISDVPYNISALISEALENYSFSVNILSYIRYGGGEEGIMSNRMMVFAEHLYGKIEKNLVIKTTPTNTILISDYTEVKNPLNVLNNIKNFQEIDYVFNYNNFVSNDYFQYLWKEIMYGFPHFLHPTHDESIKNIIGKNINDFYRSKGTPESMKLLFKMIYNEDLEVGTNIYSSNTFSYTIETNNYGSSDTLDYVKKLVHPVGYDLTLTSK